MKKSVAAAAAMLIVSAGAEAAYRDNGGIKWPTLFDEAKSQCQYHRAAKETTKVVAFDSVQFGYKSTEVSGSKEDLAKAKAAIEADAEARFIVVGHTDSVGSESYNQTLSEQRAEAVLGWLLANGVDAGRVSAIGMGETRPIGDNNTAEGRAENRRVELHRSK